MTSEDIKHQLIIITPPPPKKKKKKPTNFSFFFLSFFYMIFSDFAWSSIKTADYKDWVESWEWQYCNEQFPCLQVLFEGRRAVGVEMVRRSRKQVIRARREVILSAGTFGSSKLLLLSGVGPKQHLNDLKVSLLESLLSMEMIAKLREAIKFCVKTVWSTVPESAHQWSMADFFPHLQ